MDSSNPATIYDVGYKQNYMLPPFWGGESDWAIPWMYDSRESLIADYGMESMVLWPVHPADMNCYLFVAPGFTREHAGDRGHVLNLAYAGYAQSLGTSSREGEPVAGVEDGNVETLYRRVGLKPAYVAEVGSDPFTNDGLSPSAWPNAYISPDDTHVLILTYYEGMLSDKWRFVPASVAGVPFGDDLYKGLDQVVEGATSTAMDAAKDVLNLTGFGSVLPRNANIDLIPDSGAVPVFQYRRVICRVVIPPEGVVTPATGWTAVTEALADAKDLLVDKVLGVIGKLIGWLEDMPGRVMAGLASLAAESVCHVGEILAAVGGGENDVGAGEEVQGVDLHLSRTEHADRLSQSRCENATQKGLNSDVSDDCTAVAAAVDDPACQSVPPVRFLETFGLPYEVEWNATTGTGYRDVWYFSYPGVDDPEGTEAYRAGLGLVDAADFWCSPCPPTSCASLSTPLG